MLGPACQRQGGMEEDGCYLSLDGAAQSALTFPSSCSVSGHPGPQPPMPGVPPQYRKAVFVEYPDASFTQPKPKPAWMGLLGPTIRAEVYDVVVITFKNLASRPYNLHAVGVSYWKASEGELGYEDETSQPEKEGDRVDPGKTHTYVWEIPQNQGPTDGDSSCLTHSYSSNTDSVKDINSGLIGALLVCRPGKDSLEWEEVTCNHELKTPQPMPHNRTELHTINGYINGSLPGLTLCLKKQVHWHVIGLGTGAEVHSIFFEAHTFLVRSHRLSSLEISPATYLTAQIMPGTAGWFQMFCQIPSHQQDEEAYHVIQVRSSAKDKPMTWTHYIAAEEMDWDYAPVKPVSLDSLFLEAGPQRVGSRYKKVMYVEYEDATFKKRKVSDQLDKGILGPVIKGEVGDQFKIVFRNLASRPYNIYPHGLTSVKPYHADVKDIPIPPGQSFIYTWKVTTEDGPTQADPRCLTRFYYSSIDPVRDTASGLIGPLLICFKKSMDQRGNQVDRTRLVLFSVFDENRSWYLEENIRRFCTDAAHVDIQDPQFYASNVMHTINGFVFDNLELKLCLHEVVYWYVLSVGAQADFLSIFFSGNTFKRNMVFEDVLTLFPFSGETVFMSVWMLGCLNPDYRDRGMRAKFTVLQCQQEQYSDVEEYVDFEEEDAYLPCTWVRDALGSALSLNCPHPCRDPWSGRRKPFQQYRKVVFREYMDDSFTQPVLRGELDEHLGILGPYIRAEVEDVIMVTFKNLASRPFSFHSTLQAYEEMQDATQGGEVVQPGKIRKYTWKVLPQMAPTTQEFDCKAWAYFSNVDLEKDLHSGLIGPLIICRRGVLSFVFRRQLAVQEFSLLFTIFDETKSWYFLENMERNCRPPCYVQQDSPAINGYVSDTLPGLVMAQQQRVRWHLLNMGSTEDIHSIHFHGQLFSVRTSQEYRMGVYNLYPGVFGTVEMWPSHAGIWRVECKVGEHQQAGMSALFLVRDKSLTIMVMITDKQPCAHRPEERQECQTDSPLLMWYLSLKDAA
uniref:Coagulation factor VIII n=1 Tax=Amazona collaria TaxID=241587 RepID=A0A8B9GNQ2_9PSIT